MNTSWHQGEVGHLASIIDNIEEKPSIKHLFGGLHMHGPGGDEGIGFRQRRALDVDKKLIA